MGRTHAGVALTPYSRETHGAELAYRIALPEDVKEVKIHVIVKSTLDFLNRGGHEYEVGIDSGTAQRVNFNADLNETPDNVYRVFYPTVARRVVEKVVTLPVTPTADGTHTVTIAPLTPGIVFEKLVIDYGGYTPQYLFGKEEIK